MSSPKPGRDRRVLAILAIILLVIMVPLGYFFWTQISSEILDQGCQCFPVNESELAPSYFGTSQMNGQLANQTAAHGKIPSYAQVISQNNTIIFRSNTIDLPVFAYPNYEAGVVINKSIPLYDCVSPCPNPSNPALDTNSPSNSFTIYGLFLPTLIMPRGSILNVTYVNMDTADHHNFVISTFPPPYAEYIMQNMATENGEMVQMTPLLPPALSTPGMVPVYQYTIHLNYNITHMWYMCMFPFHANQGMWGNITLV